MIVDATRLLPDILEAERQGLIKWVEYGWRTTPKGEEPKEKCDHETKFWDSFEEECVKCDRDATSKYALQLKAENKQLEALINNPHIDNFIEAVRLEAAHQRERWPPEHDERKTDADWFWLIGYLAGKILRPDQTPEKRLHHIITTAAVCLNWHKHSVEEKWKDLICIKCSRNFANEKTYTGEPIHEGCKDN